jgi:hypothetical protein
MIESLNFRPVLTLLAGVLLGNHFAYLPKLEGTTIVLMALICLLTVYNRPSKGDKTYRL